jgi:hypothetical protein
MSKNWIFLTTLLLACSDEPKNDAPKKGDPTKSESADAGDTKANVKHAPKMLPKELIGNANQIALVPSPAEMQKSLKNADIKSDLSELIRKDLKISMDVDNKDQVAVRVGVVMADLVLTIKTSDKALKLDRLQRLKSGFAKLGAGNDVALTIDELSKNIENESVSNDDLLMQFDELSGVMVPELEYEAGEWVVPLIQAGSWLEGSYLVSSAIIKEGAYSKASDLLRQPEVAEYFLKYVQREGKAKAPDAVVEQLEKTLLSLKTIANKEVISEADVKSIQTSTQKVLTLL